jgi:hypothetical protein
VNKLIERVRLILTTPKTEWPVIAAEPATTGGLYTGYIMILAAIPAICMFLKMAFIGTSVFGLGAYRVGMTAAVGSTVLSYALSLVGVYILALIIDALAPTFGGQKDRMQALKTAAYAYTAAWVAGVGALLPWLGWLIMIAGAVYSIYLLYLGLPHTMKGPPEKAAGYTAVTVIIGIVLSWIIGLVSAGVMGSAMWAGMAGAGSGISIPGASGGFDKGSPLGKLEAWSKKVESAGKQMEQAQKSGSAEDQGQAMNEMMGAVLGGAGGAAEALPPERLKAFVPGELNGLPRTEISASRNAAMGIQVANAHGNYSDNAGRNLRLEITDAGGARGFMALAGWANVESETENQNGYERTSKIDGRMVHEQWTRNSDGGGYGKFSSTVADRFMVEVSGNAGSIDELKSALASVNLAGLEALKNEGVKAN